MAIRVYQIAKEYDRSSEEVMAILKQAGVDVGSHTAVLDQHALYTVRAKLAQLQVTVVDGEEETEKKVEPPKETKPPAPKVKKKKTTRKKKKKKKDEEDAANPALGVRIIKRHEDEEDEANQEGLESDEDSKPKLRKHPSLKRRRTGLKARLNQIQRIADRRAKLGQADDVVPPPKPSAKGDVFTPPPDQGRRKGDNRRRDQKSGRPKRVTNTELTKNLKKALSGPAPNQPPAAAKPGSRLRHTPYKPHGKRKKRKRRRREKVDRLALMRSSVKKVDLPEDDLGIIMLSEGVTVKELAEKINRLAKDVIKRLFERGIMATVNHVLDTELAIDLAKDFGYLAEIVSFEEDLQMQDEEILAQEESAGDTAPRAPIVTVMGHVDHGKTSLLDAIRGTRVASGEAGGITQRIGAYAVTCKDKEIVFLDTPGHEAFTKMRARGASVTDIVVLVVAADDGVKPQTIEAIHHAHAAKVPIIIAINKVDKPEANPDRVKSMLTEHELVVEEFGGDSPCVLVSAKTDQGIQELLEMILLVSELQELNARPEQRGRGSVVEAKLDKGRGSVATILIQDGSVSVGDHFITGATYGKIRAMFDDMGEPIDHAGPSTPVEILGIQSVPQAGDPFQVVADESKARQISSFRKERQREDELRMQKHMSLDQLFSKMNEGEIKELPLIVKAEAQGSIEGICHALEQIESKKVALRVISRGVGNVTETDVHLAMASDAVIIGFHTKVEPGADDLAKREDIEIRLYDVIYNIITEIQHSMLGLLEPEYEEQHLGRLTVRQVFKIPKIGKVAGCVVDSGVVKRDAKVRLLRGGEEVARGTVSTLKRFKDDVAEVKAGYECGVGITGFTDYQDEDVMEVFAMEEVQPSEL